MGLHHGLAALVFVPAVFTVILVQSVAARIFFGVDGLLLTGAVLMLGGAWDLDSKWWRPAP